MPGPKYTTQCMRVCNVWRSFGHHKKISAACESIHGRVLMEAHCGTCIGKPTRTRWGAFDGPERKLLRGKLGAFQPLENQPALGTVAPPGTRFGDACSQAPREGTTEG